MYRADTVRSGRPWARVSSASADACSSRTRDASSILLARQKAAAPSDRPLRSLWASLLVSMLARSASATPRACRNSKRLDVARPPKLTCCTSTRASSVASNCCSIGAASPSSTLYFGDLVRLAAHAQDTLNISFSASREHFDGPPLHLKRKVGPARSETSACASAIPNSATWTLF